MTEEYAASQAHLDSRFVKPEIDETESKAVVRGRIELGDLFRCQLGRKGQVKVKIQEGWYLICDTFHLIAFGSNWDEALAMWQAKQPKLRKAA